jgi:hypothetical protein
MSKGKQRHLHGGNNARPLNVPGGEQRTVPAKEESVQSWTNIHFDWIDRLRILLGARVQIKITTNVLLHAGASIKGTNANAEIKITTKTKHAFEQDRPRYGYAETPSSASQIPTRKQVRDAVNKEIKERGLEVDKMESLSKSQETRTGNNGNE